MNIQNKNDNDNGFDNDNDIEQTSLTVKRLSDKTYASFLNGALLSVTSFAEPESTEEGLRTVMKQLEDRIQLNAQAIQEEDTPEETEQPVKHEGLVSPVRIEKYGRFWKVYFNEYLLAVVVYRRGAETVKVTIEKLMSTIKSFSEQIQEKSGAVEMGSDYIPKSSSSVTSA